MANFFLKLKLVIWKNFLIRKRHKILSIFEILMTVILFILLPIIQTTMSDFGQFYENRTYIEPPVDLTDSFFGQYNIFYTPNDDEINKLMDKVALSSNVLQYEGFSNEKEMLNRIANFNMTRGYAIGLQFDKGSFPKKLKYQIRTSTFFGGQDITSLFPSLPPYYNNPHKDYVHSGFVMIQKLVDFAYINMVTKGSQSKVLDNMVVSVQQMPIPPHEIDNPTTIIYNYFIPMFGLLSFVLIFPSVLKRVIEEKCSGIKELMKMMGLKSWMIWLGWFLHSMVTNIISITFITIMLKITFSSTAKPTFENANPFIIWLFFLFYCISGICFSFAASTLFNKPTLGMSLSMLAWNVTFFTTIPVADAPENYSQSLINFLLIFPNMGLLFAIRTINQFEKHDGLTFSNLFTKPDKYTPAPSMGHIMLMHIFDSILFLIITWYIDNVHPGNYGTPRKWYFPFTKSYWCTNKINDDNFTGDNNFDNRPEIEPISNDLKPGIQIRNLRKRFGTNYAVDGLNINIYNKQITILLGHNGAGKTTTMNIITGMLPPSNGTVIVDGYNIFSDMDSIRNTLGLCPQHNLQFPDLTVLEHLIFFAMLKGLSKEDAETESLEFLQRLNLTSKSNKMASTLSGGMRRKLSLGMALVGKTKVLMLDEPTSGLDPEARREIWDFLLSMRGERTILITTHYMEEADILGDRIAIMHHGQLMCYGTSLFLKKHYGTGYTLSVLTATATELNKNNSEKIKETICSFIPTANIKNITTGNIIFALPTNDTNALANLFQHLEYEKEHLGIANFGVSITSLEDVFLRVGELADTTEATKTAAAAAGNTDNTSSNGSGKFLLSDNFFKNDKEYEKTTLLLYLQQFTALFIKRIRFNLHRLVFFTLQALVPVIMGLILFTIMKTNTGKQSENMVFNLDLNKYGKTETYYSIENNLNNSLGEIYEKIVKSNGGKIIKTDSVQEAIINVGEVDQQKFLRSLITAAEFNGTMDNIILNGLYGCYALHGPAISLNLITNTLVKWLTNINDYSINVINHMLPSKSVFNMNMGIIMLWIFQIPVAYTIMIGFFLGFPQCERLTGVKHLQLMAGVPRVVYWLTNFLFDFVVYVLVTALVIVILILFDSNGIFGTVSSIMALLTLILLFGLSGIPFAYLFHYRPTAASSMTVFLWIQIIFGTIGAVVMYFLKELLSSGIIEKQYQPLIDTFTYILLFVPNFAFSDGIQKYANKASQIYQWHSMTKSEREYREVTNNYPCKIINSKECHDFLSFYRGHDSIINNVIYLIVDTFIFWCLFLLIDSGLPRKWFDSFSDYIYYKNNKQPINTHDDNDDDDVTNEREHIKQQINSINGSSQMSSNNEDILIVYNLRKWFKRFYAVRGLSFGVKRGECFGLLGINGAGKTTTFKMLTGDLFPTTGLTYIQKILLNVTNKTEYLKQIGYCPQFDALNMELTTREMLELFASIRGIKPALIKKHVDKWIQKFDIKKYENIQCGKLSGGNKRKLSTAIALIGDPPLIMLDEPTSGVDPVARRNLWDILGELRRAGQSIVLTSHSMDECEALCDRLGIMVDGQMKCLGNIQYLKNKFGQGFTVFVKLKTTLLTDTIDGGNGDVGDGEAPIITLKNHIESKYVCTLKDEHTGMILYHVTSDTTLGELFSFMETLKSSEAIVEDYAVSDTSLEQVFLSFAKTKINTNNPQRQTPNQLV